MEESMVEITDIPRLHQQLVPLYSEECTLGSYLIKQLIDVNSGGSNQDKVAGRQEHPFDFEATALFKNYNEHHSTCIETKKEALVGLGFWPENWEKILDEQNPAKRRRLLMISQSKESRILDPLCEISYQDVLGDIAEDYIEVGNGYQEVVRKDPDDPKKITGLHHIPAANVYVVLEEDGYNKHYEIVSTQMSTIGERKFARFGDKEDFIKRNKISKEEAETVSELIHYRRPSSLCRCYGMPDWLAGTVSIELSQCMNQHTFDFYLNRGVPEFMIFFLEKKLDPNDWAKIKKAMKANIGFGNAYKSLALNIPSEVKIQLEKLGLEGKSDDTYKDQSDTLALKIVSAHRVPPLIAGIQIPGKLGASNELANALMAFQTLAISTGQKLFRTIHINNLGNPELNGGLELGSEDFVFRTILDEIEIDKVDTIGKMRQPLPEAQAEGRDLAAGPKD